MPSYRLYDTTGYDLGLLEHLSQNVEPRVVVVLADGREVLVTSRVERAFGPLAAMLEVAVAPSRLDTSLQCPPPPRDRASAVAR